MLFALSGGELDALYAAPGLELYRPQPILVVQEQFPSATVTTYNLESPALAGDPDPEYAARLRGLLERLNLPSEGVRA